MQLFYNPSVDSMAKQVVFGAEYIGKDGRIEGGKPHLRQRQQHRYDKQHRAHY